MCPIRVDDDKVVVEWFRPVRNKDDMLAIRSQVGVTRPCAYLKAWWRHCEQWPGRFGRPGGLYFQQGHHRAAMLSVEELTIIGDRSRVEDVRAIGGKMGAARMRILL